MKKLFNSIFIIGLAFVGIPALGLAVMYDGSGAENMPLYLYTDDADAKRMMYAELDSAIKDVENDETVDMIYNLNQDIINTAIYEVFKGDDFNPDYQPGDDCTEDACKYVYSTQLELGNTLVDTRVMGAWVDFKEDVFIVNLYLELGVNDGFTYDTVLRVYFNFHDYEDRYELLLIRLK